MGTRWIRLTLVIAIAFALTVVCEHVLTKSYAQQDLPFRGIPLLCLLLTSPGYAITKLLFGEDLPRAWPFIFQCSLIVSNTLIYSGLFGLFLLFVTEPRQSTTPSTKPLLKGLVLRLLLSAVAALIFSGIGMGLYFLGFCWDDTNAACSQTRRWIAFLLAAPIFLMQRLFGRAENRTNFDPVVFGKFGWAVLWAYYYAIIRAVSPLIRRFRKGSLA